MVKINYDIKVNIYNMAMSSLATHVFKPNNFGHVIRTRLPFQHGFIWFSLGDKIDFTFILSEGRYSDCVILEL